MSALGVDFLVLIGFADIDESCAVFDLLLGFLGADFLHLLSIPESLTLDCESPKLSGMRPDPRHLIIDLRPDALREAEPLSSLLPNPSRAVSLAAIEEERHELTSADGPLVVICERGVRSTLAARLLRSDGLEAQAYAGGVPALRLALKTA